MKKILGFVGCLFLFASCQSEKPKALDATSGVKSAVTAGDRRAPTGMMLNFISIGAGIDTAAYEKAQSIIQNRVSLGEVEEFKQKPYGIEGDVFVCVNLKSYDLFKVVKSEMEIAGIISDLVQLKTVNDCSEIMP